MRKGDLWREAQVKTAIVVDCDGGLCDVGGSRWDGSQRSALGLVHKDHSVGLGRDSTWRSWNVELGLAAPYQQRLAAIQIGPSCRCRTRPSRAGRIEASSGTGMRLLASSSISRAHHNPSWTARLNKHPPLPTSQLTFCSPPPTSQVDSLVFHPTLPHLDNH